MSISFLFVKIAGVKGRHGSILGLFQEEVGRPLRHSVSLRRYSRFKIGGKADLFFSARSLRELHSCLRFVRDHSLPFYVIGDGTNILFDDRGYRGLIIKNKIRGEEKLPEEGLVGAFSGSALSDLVEFSKEEGLAGLEFAAGIPGTVGGAVFGNAGAFGRCIGEILEEAVLLDGYGREFCVKNDYFKFAYRHSVLKKKHLIILKAVFRLRRGDRRAINAAVEENLGKRKRRHPAPKTAYPGSYFKNPVSPDGSKVAAGYLLEKVGAKELSVGGAAVFPGHANFILNLGRARAQDVLRLADELKARVKKEFGIKLEEEVIYLPEDFSMP